jgi:hypothetical protein
VERDHARFAEVVEQARMIIGCCEVVNCGNHAPESPILVSAFVWHYQRRSWCLVHPTARPLIGYLFNGATSRSDGAWSRCSAGRSLIGCPPASVALIWHALLPGTAWRGCGSRGVCPARSSVAHLADS